MLAAAIVTPDARLDLLLDAFHGTWHGRAVALAALETVLGLGDPDEFGEGTAFIAWCHAPHTHKDVVGAIRAALIQVSNRIARNEEEEDATAADAKRERFARGAARKRQEWERKGGGD